MQKCSLVPGLPPQLSSLAVRITMRSVIRTALRTASDDSCVRGGLHGYKATGHAREKPICRFAHTKLHGDLEIIFLEKKKVEFSAVSDAAGPEKQGIYLPRPNCPELPSLQRN